MVQQICGRLLPGALASVLLASADAYAQRPREVASAAVFDGIVKLDFARADSKPASAIASAVKVLHRGQEYLVTAYHNIHGSSLCIGFSALQTKGFHPLFGPSSEIARPGAIDNHVYIDVGADLAVVKLLKPGLFGTRVAPLRLCEDGVATTAALGSSAAAFATPSRRGVTAASDLRTAVAYHCTVSRDGVMDGMLNADNILRADYTGPAELPEGVTEAAARRIGLRAKTSTDYLLVETVSVNAGFSGTAIVVSGDSFQSREGARIAGIVLGGNPSDASQGRWVLATSYKSIAEAIDRLESSLAGNWQPEAEAGQFMFTLDEFPIRCGRLPRPILTDGHSADWIVTISPQNVERSAWSDGAGEGGLAPLNISGASAAPGPSLPDGVSLIDGRLLICGDTYLKKLNKDYPGCELHFQQCNFDARCLDRAILLRAVFDDCQFRHTQFKGAVLSGCTFADNCIFTPESYHALSHSWSHGVRYPTRPRLGNLE